MLPQKRRGPPPTGKGQQIVTRLHDDLLGPLDAFSAAQNDKPSRPEAIRRLVRNELERLGYLQSAGAPDQVRRPDQLDATNDD